MSVVTVAPNAEPTLEDPEPEPEPGFELGTLPVALFLTSGVLLPQLASNIEHDPTTATTSLENGFLIILDLSGVQAGSPLPRNVTSVSATKAQPQQVPANDDLAPVAHARAEPSILGIIGGSKV